MISDCSVLPAELLGQHGDDVPYLLGEVTLTHGGLREAVAREAATLRVHVIGPESCVAVQVPRASPVPW